MEIVVKPSSDLPILTEQSEKAYKFIYIYILFIAFD